MSRPKLLSLMMGLMSAVLLLVACAAPQATHALPTPEAVATSTPGPPTAPHVATATPVPPTPTPAPQVPVGRIKGVLINAATGQPLAGETFSVALIHEADKLDEKTCTIKARATGVILRDEQTGGAITGLGQEFLTDEKGGFLFPGKRLGSQLIVQPGTDTFFMFLNWNNRCFVIRDKSGDPISIQMGTQAGVDLGEILITPTSIPLTEMPTPVPISISGTAHSTDDPPQPAPGRKIVLCFVEEVSKEEGTPFVTASCVLDATLTTITDSEGRFEFQGLPDGTYMILYDSPQEDFERGLRQWDGKVIKVGDVQWLEQFEVEEGKVPFNTAVINEIMTSEGSFSVAPASIFRVSYMGAVLGFPFLIAIQADLSEPDLVPVIADVTAREITEVDIEVFGSRQD